MPIASGTIGASLTQVWKPDPNVPVGADNDPLAPFALGTMVVLDEAAYQVAQFCRVDSVGVSNGDDVAIINGVTDTATANNVWTNNTGVDLVEGDYAFLMGSIINAVGA